MKRNLLIIGLLLTAIAASAFEHFTINSKYVQSPADVIVALPDGYDDKAADAYPVVYMLHGHGGNYKSWSSITNIDSLATAYRVIIVCPDGRNSWYWDSPLIKDLQMESYITKELVPWVDKKYNTRADSTGRAITGLSMGGHGAMWLGLRHPDIWLNIGSMSGGVDIRPFPKKWNMAKSIGSKEQYPQRWNDYTVATLATKVAPHKWNIIFDCGTEDFFYDVNRKLENTLKKRKMPHTYMNRPGIHNAAYWHDSAPLHLAFFDRYFYPKGR